jgi:hypothetical protein
MEMSDKERELLAASINHILDSGANDIRLIELYESFEKRRYMALHDKWRTPHDGKFILQCKYDKLLAAFEHLLDVYVAETEEVAIQRKLWRTKAGLPPKE